MLKIKFADNSEYAVHEDTTVHPSGSSAYRSHMDIHMAEDAMTFDEFEALMTDEVKTSTMHLIRTAVNDNNEEVVVSDIAYTAYTFVRSIGKKQCEVVDHTTGATTSEPHLVATLEQLTYIEQQLAKLGL